MIGELMLAARCSSSRSQGAETHDKATYSFVATKKTVNQYGMMWLREVWKKDPPTSLSTGKPIFVAKKPVEMS